MKENKESKKIYFWVAGEKFDEDNISRIYDEMKYNCYLPSDLANGLAENDYGAITNIKLEEAKEFARNKMRNLNINNPFCYLIEREYSFTENEWDMLIDNDGNINLSKLGMSEFPEFEEPTYSISRKWNNKDANNKNPEEENTIHIKSLETINSAVLDLVTSNYNTGFRLLNKLYDFSEETDIFTDSKDLERLNRAIQQKNQNNLTKVQKLDKLGKALEGIIPLKIVCYMISDAKLLFGSKKEYSAGDIEKNKKENEQKLKEFSNEKEKMIKEVRDFSRKVGLNIENIFDRDGKLVDRKLTIDNPEFKKELSNLEIEYEKKNKAESQSLNKEESQDIGD